MSKSWKLHNVDGSSDFIKGQMDISFVNGSVEEITSPVEIINQRLQKCIIEPRASNVFSPLWGFNPTQVITKNFGSNTATVLASLVDDMFTGLISSQKEVQLRISLAPAELIDSLREVSVQSVGSRIDLSVRIATQTQNELDLQFTGAVP